MLERISVVLVTCRTSAAMSVLGRISVGTELDTSPCCTASVELLTSASSHSRSRLICDNRHNYYYQTNSLARSGDGTERVSQMKIKTNIVLTNLNQLVIMSKGSK